MFDFVQLQLKLMYFQCFSIDREWKSLTEEGQILLETDVSSVKDFTKYLQDKAELSGHICSTEPMNLNVFLNNVVC